jgi:hypothetical protein
MRLGVTTPVGALRTSDKHSVKEFTGESNVTIVSSNYTRHFAVLRTDHRLLLSLTCIDVPDKDQCLADGMLCRHFAVSSQDNESHVSWFHLRDSALRSSGWLHFTSWDRFSNCSTLYSAVYPKVTCQELVGRIIQLYLWELPTHWSSCRYPRMTLFRSPRFAAIVKNATASCAYLSHLLDDSSTSSLLPGGIACCGTSHMPAIFSLKLDVPFLRALRGQRCRLFGQLLDGPPFRVSYCQI